MSLRPNDLALRRLVARLARLTPNDIDAIIGNLDAPQRVIVQDLINSYSLRKQPKNTLLDGQVLCKDDFSPTINGFSPWIIERLSAVKHERTAESRTFQMTDHALNVLFCCAADLRASTELPLVVDAHKHQPLLRRIWRAFMAWKPMS